jgi:mono/diheme cytochrome c family protein
MRIFLTMIGLMTAFTALAGENAIKLKSGPGKDLVIDNCAVCHSLDYIPVNSGFLDRDGWQKTVDKMINVMGAHINANDVAPIVDYLTQNYGK